MAVQFDVGSHALCSVTPQSGGKDVVHITAVQAARLNGVDEDQNASFDVVAARGYEAARDLKLA